MIFEFRLPLVLFSVFLLYALGQLFFNAPVFYTARNEWLTLFAYFMTLLILMNVLADSSRGFNLLLFLILCVGLLSGYALILHFKGLNHVLWLERPAQYGMRASGTFICPNHFAHVVAMAMILCISLLSISRISVAFKLIVGYSLLLSALPLVLTQSRSGVLGFVSGASLTVLLICASRGKRMFRAALVALPLAVGGLGVAIYFCVPAFKARFLHALKGDIRLSIWPDTLDMISAQPIWGHGPGSFTFTFAPFRRLLSNSDLYLRYAHNEYLHLIAEYGLVGLIIFVAACMTLTAKVFHIYLKSASSKDRYLASGVLGVFLCSAVHAIFDFQLHMFANCLFLVVVVSVLLGRSNRGTVRNENRTNYTKLISVVGFIFCSLLALYCGSLAYAETLRLQGSQANKKINPTAPLGLFKKSLLYDSAHPAAYLEQGLHALSLGFWTRKSEDKVGFMVEADEYFDETLRLNPFELKALWGKAQIAEERKDLVMAEELLREIIHLDPYFSYYHMQYGLMLKRWGRSEEALEQLHNVLKMDPENDIVRLNIEQVKQRLKQ